MSGSFGPPLTPAPIWWQPKYPGEVTDYAWPIPSTIVADPADIVALTAQAAPSGTGQLALNSLSLDVGTLVLNESQGQPGSTYTLLFTATMVDGEVVQWETQQQVLPYLPSDVAVVATSPGFGPAVVWNAALPMALNLFERLSTSNIALMM